MYGNCNKCNHELVRHYEDFCPKCNTNVLEMFPRVFDLFKVMYHMEANGYMSKKDFWNYLTENTYNINNDTYMDMWIEWDNDPCEINEYYEGMAKILGLENGERVVMQISW